MECIAVFLAPCYCSLTHFNQGAQIRIQIEGGGLAPQTGACSPSGTVRDCRDLHRLISRDDLLVQPRCYPPMFACAALFATPKAPAECHKPSALQIKLAPFTYVLSTIAQPPASEKSQLDYNPMLSTRCQLL